MSFRRFPTTNPLKVTNHNVHHMEAREKTPSDITTPILTPWEVSPKETSPKSFLASKFDVGNWIFSKSWEFFQKLFRSCLNSLGKFFGGFFGEIFWEEFFGRIFWEEFFVYISINLIDKILVLSRFCLKSQGRTRILILRSAIACSSH